MDVLHALVLAQAKKRGGKGFPLETTRQRWKRSLANKAGRASRWKVNERRLKVLGISNFHKVTYAPRRREYDIY